MRKYAHKITRGLLASIATMISISLLAQNEISVDLPGIKSHLLMESATNGAPTIDDGDAFGISIARIGDLDQDGIEDLAVGAYLDDDTSYINYGDYGAVYICFMKSDKTIKSYKKISASDTVFHGGIDIQDQFGSAVLGIGDLNGDGFLDLAVGAMKDDDGATDAGAVWILYLDTAGTVLSTRKLSSDNYGVPILNSLGYFGVSLAAIGDINNDGIMDIGVGAHNDIKSGVRVGSYYVLKMNSNGTVMAYKRITESEGGFTGDLDALDQFGISGAGMGDLNGDGVPDIAVGANRDDDGITDAGAVWIMYLDTSGTVTDHNKITVPMHHRVYDLYNGYTFGRSILATDINTDGNLDLIVGANSGEHLFLIALDSSQNVITSRAIGDYNSWDNVIVGAAKFGSGVTMLDDIDGDGIQELVVSAMQYVTGGGAKGAFFVFTLDSLTYEFTEGDVVYYDKIGDISGSFTATFDNSDNFGVSVANIGDVNRDGIDDIAVGAHKDDDGGTDRGAVYILFLDTLARVSSYQKISSTTGGFPSGTLDNSDQFGFSVAAMGDLNGDTIPDIAVGAPLDDDGGSNYGAVWIIYLNSDGTVKDTAKISTGHRGFSASLSTNNGFGASITSIGDINNDGVNDIAIGAYNDDDGGTDRGAVYVLKMDTTEFVINTQKISDTQGSFSETFSNTYRFGVSVDALGDFNGDTIPDIVVGGHLFNTTGAVFLIFLDTSGAVKDYVKINNANSNFPETLQSTGNFGRSVAVMDDIDGNGVRDLLVGSNGIETYGATKGGVWVVFLDSSGTVINTNQVSESRGKFYATLNEDDNLGSSLGYYGKDSTGAPRFFVGNITHDEGGTDRGALYSVVIASSQTISIPPPQYANLRRELDGGIYKVDFGQLRFRYFEKYNDSDGELTYNIYNTAHEVVYSSTSFPLTVVYGMNNFTVNVGSTGAGLSLGYYVLEVINEKHEKYYLRFFVPVSFTFNLFHP